jgi:predicted esterase
VPPGAAPESGGSVTNTSEAEATEVEPTPGRAGFELVALPVPGFLDAVVALPRDERPRPLAVATHGAGGGPEWPCEAWGERLLGERIVLCPRGRAISLRADHGFYYPDHRALGAEVLAAVAACKARLGPRVSNAPILYAGYSQGASMGSLALAEHGSEYPHLILTEGGFKEWSPQSARRFAQSGGKRVLFVCGGRGCRDHAEKAARLLEGAGVSARVEHVPHGGHTDGGAVGQRLDVTFRWVLGDGEATPRD